MCSTESNPDGQKDSAFVRMCEWGVCVSLSSTRMKVNDFLAARWMERKRIRVAEWAPAFIGRTCSRCDTTCDRDKNKTSVRICVALFVRRENKRVPMLLLEFSNMNVRQAVEGSVDKKRNQRVHRLKWISTERRALWNYVGN